MKTFQFSFFTICSLQQCSSPRDRVDWGLGEGRQQPHLPTIFPMELVVLILRLLIRYEHNSLGLEAWVDPYISQREARNLERAGM